MEYSQELINAVNKYNENLDSIADKILRLKIQLNNEDIEVNNLQSIFGKLKVINNTKLRNQTELLTEIIHEYGYQLKCLVRVYQKIGIFVSGVGIVSVLKPQEQQYAL